MFLQNNRTSDDSRFQSRAIILSEYPAVRIEYIYIPAHASGVSAEMLSPARVNNLCR